jgi:hypothetical protein
MPSDGASGFGRAIAFDGTTVIVGAGGAAYLFRREAPGAQIWDEVAKLVTNDSAPGFGTSVDVDGNHAIVGAPGTAGGESGAVYVFRVNRGNPRKWKEVARLDSGGPLFGVSVGISGDTAIVGETLISPMGGATADIFQRNQGGSGKWGLVRNLGKAGFGSASVAIDGDTAMLTTGFTNESTRVDIFGRNIGGPDAWGKEPMQQSGAGLGTGRSPSISGDKAIFVWSSGFSSVRLFSAETRGLYSRSSRPPVEVRTRGAR